MKRVIFFFLFFLSCCSAFSQRTDVDSFNRSVTFLYRNNKVAEAEELITSALSTIDRTKKGSDSAYLYSLFYASEIYAIRENYKRQDLVIRELDSLVQIKFGRKSYYYLNVLYQYFQTEVRLDNYQKATAYLDEVYHLQLELYHSGKEIEGFIGKVSLQQLRVFINIALNTMAYVNMLTGNTDNAKQYFSEAKKYLDREYYIQSNPIGFVDNYLREASFLTLSEHLEEAEQVYREAREWIKKYYPEDHPSYAHLLISNADFYYSIGQTEKAAAYYFEGKKILENTFQKGTPGYGNLLEKLGSYYLGREEYNKAENLFNRALQIITSRPHTSVTSYATCNLSLTKMYIRQKEFEKAGTVLARLDSFFQISSNNLSYLFPQYLSQKAYYLSLKNEFYAADSLYNSYLVNWQKDNGTNTTGYSYTLLLKAKNFFSWNKTDSCKKYLLESLDISKGILFKNFIFFSEQQRQNYLHHFSEYQDFLYLLNETINDKDLVSAGFEIQLFLKNLLLHTSVFANRKKWGKNTTEDRQFDEYLGLKHLLVDRYFMDNDKHKQDLLENRTEELEKKLSKASVAFIKEEFKPVQVSDISSALKSREAIVDFFKYKKEDSVFYGAFILKQKDSFPVAIQLFEERELQKIITSRMAGSEPFINLLYTFHSEKQPSLYKLIWEKIDRHLASVNTIYLSPVGLLNKISFPAIPVNDSNLIMNNYSIRLNNSCKSILHQNDSLLVSSLNNIALYGDINYDTDSTAIKHMANAQTTYTTEVNLFSRGPYSETNSWNPLPGTKREVNAIAKLYPSKNTKIFAGNAATEESFKSLSGKSPSVIHLATHGFFFSNFTDSIAVKNFSYVDKFKRNDNPLLRSGLILSGANLRWRNGKAIKGLDDGILTSYEISLLDLSHTNLAILSACETGLGDIEGSEGVYGLQRAFKMAGLEYLVMSLWKVPDIETAEFMQEFHRNIFLRQTVTDAFYHAQMTMKNKYQLQPYKWAAWVLVR